VSVPEASNTPLTTSVTIATSLESHECAAGGEQVVAVGLDTERRGNRDQVAHSLTSIFLGQGMIIKLFLLMIMRSFPASNTQVIRRFENGLTLACKVVSEASSGTARAGQES
jgi:hypothetical protein